MIVRSETVFTLHTAHTSYQLAVGPEGVLLHTYYGPRLPDNAPALADGRVPHSDPGCWPDLLPQELSGSGTADNRTPAVVPEYAHRGGGVCIRPCRSSCRQTPAARPAHVP